MDNSPIAILSSARTPIGKLNGTLSSIPATELGAVAIRAALDKAKLEPGVVDYTIMGNVLSAGIGQAPARQAAIRAGIPDTQSALTINKVCASGMMAVVLAGLMVRAGDADVVVAGGMENMSRAPHLLPDSRVGQRLGDQKLIDSMVHDGLWCCFSDSHMGTLAEKTAIDFEVTRSEQDEFALGSNQKAYRAIENGSFVDEISPVVVPGRQETTTVEIDEGPRSDTSLEILSRLSTPFPPHNSVTSGNSSQISDGAAALVITSEKKARSMGLEPTACIEDQEFVANEPSRLFEAPSQAIRNLLGQAGMGLSDVDLLDVNEAFSAQVVANGKELDWDWEKINVNGGAVALGHPIGASGARILVTLLHALEQRDLENGIAAVCHGGGGAVGMRISRR